MMTIILLIAALINVAVIWCIFSIRKSSEQQAFISLATFQLLKRIAEKNDINADDIKSSLDKEI